MAEVLNNPDEAYFIARTAHQQACDSVQNILTDLSQETKAVMEKLESHLNSFRLRPGGWRHEMTYQTRVQNQIDSETTLIFWEDPTERTTTHRRSAHTLHKAVAISVCDNVVIFILDSYQVCCEKKLL